MIVYQLVLMCEDLKDYRNYVPVSYGCFLTPELAKGEAFTTFNLKEYPDYYWEEDNGRLKLYHTYYDVYIYPQEVKEC